MNGKRKRADNEDDSDDEPSLGRQILPVARNLPSDGVPVDGMQYLFTVRRDARYLPHVTRVANPYELPEILPPNPDVVQSKHPSLPSVDWSQSFESHFNNFRRNLSQATINVQLPAPTSGQQRLMPDKRERDHWWAFLAGENESCWNPPKLPKQMSKARLGNYGQGMRGFEEHMPPTVILPTNEEAEVETALTVDPGDSLPTPSGSPSPVLTPREPTPSLIRKIDNRMALHLLMYFTHWIQVYIDQPPPSPNPSKEMTETHARWIFSLLARVDEQLPGDDVSLLRNLSRVCLALLKRLASQRLAREAADTLTSEPKTNCMSERSCWLLIATVVGGWGQRDLWMDAEAMLAEISATPP